MPKRKAPSTLQNVCYNSVVTHIDDFWSADYLSKCGENQSYQTPLHILGPFDNTPPKFLENILEQLLKRNRLRKHHLDLLLMPSVKKLKLTKWNNLNTFLSKSHYKEKLQYLTYLDLSLCQIPKKMFLALAESIPNIETLNLKATKCDDKVLSILGANCPNLQTFDIENCSAISDIGIYSLILSLNDLDQEQQRCIKIRDLNVHYTGVTRKGAACALVNLPNLVRFNNQNTLEALEYALNSSHASKTYKLEDLVVTSDSDGWDITHISIKQLQLAVKHLPNVKSIMLHQVRFSHTMQFNTLLDRSLLNFLGVLSQELAKFEHLQEFSMTGVPYDDGYTFLQFYDFVNIRGANLTQLNIVAFNFNVNLVGLYCPNLISLHLETILNYEFMDLTQKCPLPYSKLEYLSINCNSTTVNTTASYNILYTYHQCHIEERDLLTLLSNCHGLKRLCLRLINELNDDLINTILLANPLLELECLELRDCIRVTDRTIAKFVENGQNSLRKLIYLQCAETTNANFQKFVQSCREKNLDIKIIWE